MAELSNCHRGPITPQAKNINHLALHRNHLSILFTTHLLNFHFLIHKMGIIMIISALHRCRGSKCTIVHKPLSRYLAHSKCSHILVLDINLITPPLSISQASIHISELRPHVLKNIFWLTFSHSITNSVFHCAPSLHNLGIPLLFKLLVHYTVFCLPSEDCEHLEDRSCASFLFESTESASCPPLAFRAHDLLMGGYRMSPASFRGDQDEYS